MSETLMRLLRLADYTTVVDTQFDEVAGWPEGELDRLLSAGLFSPGEPAHSLICEECGEIEDVIQMESIVSPPFVPYLRCGMVGPYRIASERLQRWRMTITQLIDAAFRGLELVGSREEVARMRLWRLGRARWAGTQWTVYFGRALHCRDTWQIINQAAMPLRSVLFVPSKAIQADVRVTKMPVVVGLDTVVSCYGNGLQFDQSQVEQQLDFEQAASLWTRSTKLIRKRGSRTALIEALRQELEDHLRSARDYAQATHDRAGSPQLLPRPTKELLAKRMRVNKSTISRCFEDESAGELRMLWDVAADLDRLLAAAGHRY